MSPANPRITGPLLDEAIRRILPPEPALAQAARAHLDSLTKPLGSLGRLEDLATQLVALRGGDVSTPFRKAVYVFAADHGIVAEGVSAYPAGVTRQMVLNFLTGGAAVNVLARLHHVALHIVDVGIDGDLDPHPDLLARKVRRGSRNMLHEPAMSHEELAQALAVGLQLADQAASSGETVIAVGEMGIGNTTSASALTAALTAQPVQHVTGRGAGLDDTTYAHKCRVLSAVFERHLPAPTPPPLHPAELLRRIGGLEIAAMTGMILGAASHGLAVVADGFISTAAAALALALAPAARPYLFAGHQSQEPGHRILLAHLGLHPILQLDMRLGEGTGALLALPILESALHLYREMATFTSAGVDTATPSATAPNGSTPGTTAENPTDVPAKLTNPQPRPGKPTP
jgi:nicotinate-nucleotide--dimethylbenzimidazole phosphoribosyltransferase